MSSPFVESPSDIRREAIEMPARKRFRTRLADSLLDAKLSSGCPCLKELPLSPHPAMSQPPDPMTNRPGLIDLQMAEEHAQADVLSQVLQLIRLRGERVYLTEKRSAWREEIPPGVSYVHYVESGQLRIEPVDAPPQIAKAGDLILLPHGRGHTLADAGAGLPVRFMGALFRYEALPLHPIVAAMPSVMMI